jgi:Na+/H+ antiporter NhaC
MTSFNRPNSRETEMNEWAEASPWLGICSLLPYLLLGILSYTEKNPGQVFFFRAENVLVTLCVSWGIIFGSLTLISGIVAMKQIYSSKDTEKGLRSAVLGIVFGLSAFMTNLVTVAIIFPRLLGD